jgi:ATP-dependent protease ClpP protease subunit
MPNWGQVLSEIQNEAVGHATASKKAVDTIRHKYLEALQRKRRRNIIAYYSGFLSKPDAPQSEITDEDKNGFMMAVHCLEKGIGLDLIIHTPGGSIAATESIVDYLRKMFGKNVVAVVPQIAMSAGTMLACSCKEIIMAKHSNLGPIDPWLRGVPAHGVIKEFEEAFQEIKNDPARLAVWQPILSHYRPTFLRQCRLAIKWSEQFAREQLADVMFAGSGTAAARRRKAAKVVQALSDVDENKSHNRHIHYDECARVGLKLSLLEDDKELQDLVLTVHHCYMHSLMNTPSYKIIENHKGLAFVKQMRHVAVPVAQAT